MKTLYLFRHGKSSWANPGAGDFERPLKERGVEAARLMGRHMAASMMRPEYVLCSAATRAQQTLSFFLEGYGDSLDSRVEDALYLADPRVISAHLGTVPNHIRSVMVVGHNPGLQYMALDLAAGTGPDHKRIEEKFPTAALAVLSCDQPGWSPILAGTFSLQGYFTPKTLQV